MKNVRLWAVAVMVTVPLVTTACGSSGGGGGSSAGGGSGSSAGGVTADQIEAKLRSDPTFEAIEKQLKGKTAAYDKVISCVAQVIAKDADPAKLQDFIDGKAELTNLGTKAQGQKAADDAQKCVTAAVSGG